MGNDTSRHGKSTHSLHKKATAKRSVSGARRAEIAKIKKTWKADIREIYVREAKDLPIHIDIPRLVSKIVIKDQSRVVFDGKQAPPDTKTVTQIGHMLAALSEGLAEEENQPAELLEACEKMEGDIANKLQGVITERLGDQSPVTGVLKAVHQKLLFPAVYYLQGNFPDEPFQDKRGTWTVQINLDSDEAVIIHTKAQLSKHEASEVDHIPEFEFIWCLELVVKLEDMTLDHVDCYLTGLYFHDHVTQQRRSHLADYFGPGFLDPEQLHRSKYGLETPGLEEVLDNDLDLRPVVSNKLSRKYQKKDSAQGREPVSRPVDGPDLAKKASKKLSARHVL